MFLPSSSSYPRFCFPLYNSSKPVTGTHVQWRRLEGRETNPLSVYVGLHIHKAHVLINLCVYWWRSESTITYVLCNDATEFRKGAAATLVYIDQDFLEHDAVSFSNYWLQAGTSFVIFSSKAKSGATYALSRGRQHIPPKRRKIYQSALRHVPEDGFLRSHRRETLKPRILKFGYFLAFMYNFPEVPVEYLGYQKFSKGMNKVCLGEPHCEKNSVRRNTKTTYCSISWCKWSVNFRKHSIKTDMVQWMSLNRHAYNLLNKDRTPLQWYKYKLWPVSAALFNRPFGRKRSTPWTNLLFSDF